jgi:hypothetical protein
VGTQPRHFRGVPHDLIRGMNGWRTGEKKTQSHTRDGSDSRERCGGERPGSRMSENNRASGHAWCVHAKHEKRVDGRADVEAALLELGPRVDPQGRFIAYGSESLCPDFAQARSENKPRKSAIPLSQKLSRLDALNARDPLAHSLEEPRRPGAGLGKSEHILNSLLEHVTLRLSSEEIAGLYVARLKEWEQGDREGPSNS